MASVILGTHPAEVNSNFVPSNPSYPTDHITFPITWTVDWHIILEKFWISPQPSVQQIDMEAIFSSIALRGFLGE